MTRAAPLLHLALDPELPEPLYRQVYQGIRDAILSGALPAGTRVPSSRRLAEEHSLSRSTVQVAFDQLIAEGYLAGAVGSGSYVAREIPGHLLRVPSGVDAPGIERAPRTAVRVGRVAEAVPLRPPRVPYPAAFWSGVPPLDVFPLAAWNRIVSRGLRRMSAADLRHGPPAGLPALREAIASYLVAGRGMRCTAEQVLVVSSAQEALELACRVLLDPGDEIWMEDPGWTGARGAFLAADARIVPVPADDDGLDVAAGIERAPSARAAYLSPSHQYPLGVTLGLERRMALLDWAAARNAWLLEDDYDSEYRYAGRPLTALHGLDQRDRVLYIGTFNKTMFPALRLAYLVVPPALLTAFMTLRRLGGQHAPTASQSALAEFIAGGHYARHLRRSRQACRERRDALLAATARHASGLLEIGNADTGLHAVAWLAPGLDDAAVSDAAARAGIHAAALSTFHAGPARRPGLVLGYAGLHPEAIDAAMARLAGALNGLPRRAQSGPVGQRDMGTT